MKVKKPPGFHDLINRDQFGWDEKHVPSGLSSRREVFWSVTTPCSLKEKCFVTLCKASTVSWTETHQNFPNNAVYGNWKNLPGLSKMINHVSNFVLKIVRQLKEARFLLCWRLEYYSMTSKRAFNGKIYCSARKLLVVFVFLFSEKHSQHSTLSCQ